MSAENSCHLYQLPYECTILYVVEVSTVMTFFLFYFYQILVKCSYFKPFHIDFLFKNGGSNLQ